MRGFGENLADGDRETDRDEGEFIGPNPPGGRRTKKQARFAVVRRTTRIYKGQDTRD